ncbi:MAG: hypothetical protein M1365_00315 [Actinobacteria bacterium]|nr:hypothetical protein [Actinomycetota bacterium]
MINSPYVNTLFFPRTLEILEKKVPTIFNSKCLNKYNLPFRIEAAQTEIGHLFEHIVLEFLSKYRNDPKEKFKGRTIWNWKVNPRGFFEIKIKTNSCDTSLYSIALLEGIKILEEIILSGVKKEGQYAQLPLQAIA